MTSACTALLHDVSSSLTVGAEVYGGISNGAGSDRSQLQAPLGVQCALRRGLSVNRGVLGGTFGATPRIGGQLGVAMEFPDVVDPF